MPRKVIRVTIKLLVTAALIQPKLLWPGGRPCAQAGGYSVLGKGRLATNTVEDKRAGNGKLAWAWAQCQSGTFSKFHCFLLGIRRCPQIPGAQWFSGGSQHQYCPPCSTCCFLSAQHSAGSLAGLPSASQSFSRTCRRLALTCLIKLDK